MHLRTSVIAGLDNARYGGRAIANLHLAADPSFKLWGNPIDIAGDQALAAQFVSFTDDDALGRRIDFQDIERLRSGNSETVSLANRYAVNPMLSSSLTNQVPST